MKLILRQRTVSVSDRDVIGVGGEATVYRHGDEALKVFHPQADQAAVLGVAEAERRARSREEKLRQFPSALPSAVVAPSALLYHDGSPCLAGYAMPLVDGAQPFARLGLRRWREGAVSNADLGALFASLAQLLQRLHQAGVVVGDLNDHNLLFAGQRIWLIDADSLQFGQWGCPVAHERFLDPRLYGQDLGQRPLFTAETDWYAFAVLWFSALVYTHPFGGVHPEYPTLIRRAEARVSVLQPSVTYPRSADPPEIMPDALREWFGRVFDAGDRCAPPTSAFTASWRRCDCGLELAAANCPRCTPRRRQRTAAVPASSDRYDLRVVARTTGRFLAAAASQRVWFLEFRDGQLWRETGELAATLTPRAGMRFAVGPRESYVAHRGQLLVLAQGQIIDRRRCADFDDEPMFALSRDGRAIYLADGQLQSTLAPTRLGAVLEGQTWLAVGGRQGLLFNRIGRIELSFTFRTDRPGLTPLELPAIGGRLRYCQASFDGAQLLLERVCERRGQESHELMVIRDGVVVATLAGQRLAQLGLVPGGGRILRGDSLLCASDQGLCRLAIDFDGATLVPQNTIPLDGVIDGQAQLLSAAGGGIVVVRPQSIVRLNELNGSVATDAP